ncbi:hypothetical protein OUZ56_004586 [Daphnia magna]|uniref:Uncharacterized protein n=1 Tax=Daphnia magna TaxID=35525 RepID=A0ABQ9YQ84_9CRUS|nr:hypothetical protein OUZ56_004586 [Daphnia magna]
MSLSTLLQATGGRKNSSFLQSSSLLMHKTVSASKWEILQVSQIQTEKDGQKKYWYLGHKLTNPHGMFELLLHQHTLFTMV